MATRIVCKDGLVYVGDLDERRTNTHHIYLLGHQHPVRKSCVQDMFRRTDTWRRVIGDTTVYDAHIRQGGDMWPREFERILYADDI